MYKGIIKSDTFFYLTLMKNSLILIILINNLNKFL